MMERYPLQPLLKIHRCNVAALAVATSRSKRTAQRWAAQGMSADQADNAAIALGTHPAVIWPNWDNEPTEKESDPWTWT